MDLDIPLSNDEVSHTPPLNISHSYPFPQPVTKTIIEDATCGWTMSRNF